MTLGERIKARREAHGMKQVELAQAVQTSQAMICQIERGTKLPSLPLGAAIAAALGCSAEELLKG